MSSYASIAFTPAVRAVQERRGSRARPPEPEPEPEGPAPLGPDELEIIETADGFYQASVSETGWPYIQFRGGPPGFVRAIGPASIGYADLRGNRQYISAGNLGGDDRVALFFMDYAGRRRLKLYGRARVAASGDAGAGEILDVLAPVADVGVVEGAVTIDVVAWAWNCPQHITQRWAADELAPLLERVADLEAEVARLRG